jgi:ABC-2 type transport system permease protein
MPLALVYTRHELIATLRAPGSFLTITLMPLSVVVFFIIPNVDSDQDTITGAIATMVVFATLLACVGQFSTTVAALRESPWGAYLRTLPVGIRPLAVSSLLTGMVVVVAAVVPIVIVGALFTSAAVSAPRLLAGILALLAAVVTFTIMGLALGYLLSLRATTIVNSILVLALAVGGGMFFNPDNMPPLVQTIAPFLPTRGATDLVLTALTNRPPDPLALTMLGIWTVALAAMTVWGFHRHEGRRFR